MIMKHRRFQFLFLLFVSFAAAVSCVLPGPGDETLLLYARSQDVYREGRFSETASILKQEKKFIPSLVLRGKAEFLSGDLAAAEKTLKRVLTLSPANTEASLFLARLFRETGEMKEAQRLADKILAEHPMDLRTLRFAAELARAKGASGEAASAVLLDRAAEASAESALVFLDRARQRWIGGNRTGALEDLGRAQALLPDDSPVFKAAGKLESVIREVSL
jgi:Flp pilus assembly protein TadD